jgi:hypothetical protein
MPSTVNKSDVSPRRTGHQDRRKAVVPAGRAARRSWANVRHPPPRSSSWGSHSCLTAPGTRRRRPLIVAGRDAPSARAASLASSAALPHPPADVAHPAQLEGLDPYASPYASSLRAPVGYPPVPACPHLSSSVPLRGGGAAAPGGALRAIDSSARPRLGRTCGPRRLRRRSQACPACH